MSIIKSSTLADGTIQAEPKTISSADWKIETSKLMTNKEYKQQFVESPYNPSEEERDMRASILKKFALGYVTMYTPRVEFNDLPVIDRMQVDQMSWNTYQPNNGQAAPGDEINAWRSRAIKPIVRNKIISIAAHATARLIFPKVFAYDEESNTQSEAAEVMRDLMEWAGDQANYANTSLHSVITSLTDPASIVYKEYGEVYRTVKRERVGKKYKEEQILDETLSGFKDTMVPVDELFIENFYENDIQKQGWLIWRRVISYSLAEAKYKNKYPDKFKYVFPGVQVIYNDANQSFYQVYDMNMRPYDVEEVVYFNRTLDLKIILVNGVMLTEPDNANPRNDKLYPFMKFGYELINNRCFYYKSLAFKLQGEAELVNFFNRIIADGATLTVTPPMYSTGGETIASDVIIPGAVTTLQDTNANLAAIQVTNAQNLQVAMKVMQDAEDSVSQSAETPISGNENDPQQTTAYQISREEQNAATVLGLFIKMISNYVKDYGKLTMGDILQYLTILDVDKITDKPELVYKTFLLTDHQSPGKHRKIMFDTNVPSEPQSPDQNLQDSYDVLKEQGGVNSNTRLFKANPEKFRSLIYMTTIDADVMNPRSDDLERAFDLETYDRMVQNPAADPDETLKLLLSTNPKTKKDPDKFIAKQAQAIPNNPIAMATQQANNPQPAGPAAGNSPLNAMGSKLPVPSVMGAGK